MRRSSSAWGSVVFEIRRQSARRNGHPSAVAPSARTPSSALSSSSTSDSDAGGGSSSGAGFGAGTGTAVGSGAVGWQMGGWMGWAQVTIRHARDALNLPKACFQLFPLAFDLVLQE